MALRRAEPDFGLQGWIDTLGLKQIFLIYSVNDSETQERRLKWVKIHNISTWEYAADPDRSLRPRHSLRKSASIYPRSAPELPPMKIPRFGGLQRGDVAYRMFQLYRFDRGNKFSHVEGWSLLKDVTIKTLFSVAVTEVMSIWFRCKRTGLTV